MACESYLIPKDSDRDLPLEQRELLSQERTRYCRCPQPPECYGTGGWHWRRGAGNPEPEQRRAMADEAYEPCPSYRSVVDRNKQFEREQRRAIAGTR